MDREHGLAFDAVAEEYDRVRPGYPEELVDLACGGLVAGDRVVEVGSGTGKLTAALAARGLAVDAVDPGEALIEVARRRAGDAVRFHLGRFEDVDLPNGAYAAVFSATAFHWIDPAVGWAKAARLLRSGGRLALLANVGVAPPELEARFLEAWRQVLPESTGWEPRDEASLWQGADERLGDISELWAWLSHCEPGPPAVTQLFHDVRLDRLPVGRDWTAETTLELVRTTSQYLRLDADGRARIEELLAAAIAAVGGRYRESRWATLVTATV